MTSFIGISYFHINDICKICHDAWCMQLIPCKKIWLGKTNSDINDEMK